MAGQQNYSLGHLLHILAGASPDSLIFTVPFTSAACSIWSMGLSGDTDAAASWDFELAKIGECDEHGGEPIADSKCNRSRGQKVSRRVLRNDETKDTLKDLCLN